MTVLSETDRHALRPAAPPDDDATRRQFLGLLAAAGLLTACGSEDMPTAPRQDT